MARSIYAEKLKEFAEFAFGEKSAFERRGRWRDFFGQRIGEAFDGRIIVDVGCFDAAYLSRLAARYPGRAFIGLDWKCKAIYDGARRVAELGLRNVALLRGRGQDLPCIFTGGEVDEIWVLHPDPCDRQADLRNRLIGEPFLCAVHAVLRDTTSTLTLKTDHAGYYQWVLGLFGLPEPTWFAAATGATTTPDARASRPRLRAGDLMAREQIPAISAALRQRFEVVMNSPDYWHDPAAMAHTAQRCFAGEATGFENRFLKKRLPIYYFEIRKRQAHRQR